MGGNSSTEDGLKTLSENELFELWKLFAVVHDSWGSEACRPENMASQWGEFVQLKVAGSPSCLEHYGSACELLSELRHTHGDRLYQHIFFDGELHRHPDPRLVSFKRFVVDEFIRVYVSLSGFRGFGGKNYTGFVLGIALPIATPLSQLQGHMMVKNKLDFDYVSIGSGVAGAVVTKRLLDHDVSASIAVVEAGKRVPLKDRRNWWDFLSTAANPRDDYHDLPIESENQSVGKEPWTFRESRLMGRGGSTVHWGDWALRFKEEDFETCSRTGRGADWQIRYQDVESFYDGAEHLLGVSGQSRDSNGVVVPPRKGEFPLDPFPFVEADRPLIHAMERLEIGYGHLPIAGFRKCMTTGTCRYCPFGARFTAAYLLDEIEENPRFTNFCYFDQSPCEQLLTDEKNRVHAAEVTNTPNLATQLGFDDFFIVAADHPNPADFVQKISYHRPVLIRLSLAETDGALNESSTKSHSNPSSLSELKRLLGIHKEKPSAKRGTREAHTIAILQLTT